MNRLLVFVLAALLLTPIAAHAQSQPTLQLGLSEFEAMGFNEAVLERFTAETGIPVQLVDIPTDRYFASGGTLDERLEALQALATLADVLLLQPDHVTPEATLAGLFLDLTPLVNADPTLDADDFFPAAWQAYQWNNAIWALPASVEPIGLVYDPARFDAAGLAYPGAHWTLDDLAAAARALAVYNPDGTVSVPGMVVWDPAYLLGLMRSVTGSDFYDVSTSPETPRLATPELDSALTLWQTLVHEGVVGGINPESTDSPAMGLTGSFGLFGLGGGAIRIGGPDSQPTLLQGALLPGGSGVVQTRGLAVSAGTQSPQEAYQLAAWLSRQPEIAVGAFGGSPARQSLVGVTPEPAENGIVFAPVSSPEQQAFTDLVLQHGLSQSQLRYGSGINEALALMADDDAISAQAALREVEQRLARDLADASARETAFSVNPPESEITLAAGEIQLRFGVSSFIMPMPNQQAWEQLARDFAAADPQVGEVVLDTDMTSPQQRTETNDCFYLPNNGLDELDLNTLLPLDPLISADPSFDPNDFVGDSLTLGQRGGMTYALPLFLTPRLLRYHSEVFAEAGLPAPTEGWTVEQFEDALRTLQPLLDDPDATPLIARDPSGTYLMALIAIYGGVPIDSRTTPPTYNFTDPTTVEAIRQVLDLAREGLIDYQELTDTGGMLFVFGGDTDDRTPIYADSLFGLGPGPQPETDPYRLTTFPTGQYNAVRYDMGTAYISASTQNADACYRWINELMRHPELFSAMPARLSQLSDPAYAAIQNPETLAAYQRFADTLAEPNTISVSSLFTGDPVTLVVQYWLNQVFDEVVLRDGDLDTLLAEAQRKTDAYVQCAGVIPPFDPATQVQADYLTSFRECAAGIDPGTAGLFPQ